MKTTVTLFFYFIIHFSIHAQVDTDSDMAVGYLEELGMTINDCDLGLIAEKIIPYSKDESIIVIPEIAENEGDDFYLFNTHILIIDHKTGKINSKYFESHETNDWVSDAVMMTDIKIDTAPYFIAEGKRAFGIRVSYMGSSRVNPYSYESLTLFERNEDELKVVLKNFVVEEFIGEWDGDCEGEFTDQKKILIMESSTTNGYFNIKVRDSISIIKNEYLKEEDDCVESEDFDILTDTLQFIDGQYQ